VMDPQARRVFEHLAGRLSYLILLGIGFVITSFDTVVTQQGCIQPSTVSMGKCQASLSARETNNRQHGSSTP
jgi:hypothetical protein